MTRLLVSASMFAMQFHNSVQTNIRYEYFPLNIDIRIQFVVILNAEYYSNIRIFCPNISEYWSEEMLELKNFYFHFLLEKILIKQKAKAVII